MGIGKQERVSRAGTAGFWITSSLLFAAALLVRWWRLDLMSFNYDQAAICERAMELFNGRIPFTGIVNSLGFRNAPGYVWSLLPAFFVTCSPLIATAWHGLLCASMIFPLAMIGRRFRSDGFAFLPAVLAAFLPPEFLAGRNLWAQYLGTPLASWALWALVCALDVNRPLEARQKFGAAALALLAWAMSVHYGAAIVLLIAAGSLWQLFHQSGRRAKMILLIPVAIISLTMLPSFADFLHRLSNPLPKPDYILEYEAKLPDPLPWWARTTDGLTASVLNSSLAEPVLDVTLSADIKKRAHWYDIFIGLTMVAGLVFCLRRVLSRDKTSSGIRKTTAALLLIWITLPVLTAGIFLEWVQPSYFAASLPAGWLALLYLPRTSNHHKIIQVVPYLVAVIIATGGIWITSAFLQSVAERQVVAANYYVPYHWQTRIADSVRTQGVSGDHVRHLSHPTFATVYGYLTTCGGDGQVAAAGETGKYAVLEDRFYVEKSPGRLAFLLESGAVQVGPELILILPSRGAAEIFQQKYYTISN